MPAKPTWHPWIPSDHFAPGGLADGLMGAWFALEGAGGTLHDLSRQGNHGSLQDGLSWQAGLSGPVLANGGNSGYAEIDHNAVLNLASPCSVAVGIRFTTENNTVILEKNGNSGFSVQTGADTLSNSEKPPGTVFMNWGGTRSDQQITTASQWHDNLAHNIVFVNRGISAGDGSVFVDGADDTNRDDPDTPSYGVSTPVYIASRAGAAPYPDTVLYALLYRRALPASDIRKLHADPYALLRPVRRWWAVALDVEAAGITHPVIGSDVVGSPIIRSNVL